MNSIKKYAPGILCCICIAAIATALSGVKIGAVSLSLVGAPVFSILIGILITAFFPTFAKRKETADGIRFTSKKILQWAVIILGFSLDIGTIAKVGGKCLPVIICTISTSLITAYLLMKAFHVNKKTACLIGVGSSICGGSAIAATAPVIDADEDTIAQSISVIFLFNVLAALIFPAFGHALGFGTEGFAIFAGTAVNDTSSVTATAATAESIYQTSGILSYAVTVKLTRTLAIIPITLALALYRTKKHSKNNNSEEGLNFSFKKIFPWFILFFVFASVLTTAIGLLPANGFTTCYQSDFIPAMKWLAKFFIAMAMGAIGLNTNVVHLVKSGGKPILLGFCCWSAITAVSIGIQYATGIFSTNI